eukprot:TRINITY_DN378_c0_g1_i2.p1 TRINITY_DN378_c0_g1~~TRINITY_DN378_c0_g1_i2.p1  ORF type:complete len:555 (-),score=208.40 TRINITY_DN378_c0_g1_i2:35-1699(-)
MKTFFLPLLLLGLFCSLVSAQAPITLTTIATTSQVVNAANEPLYSPSIFAEITYFPANNSFNYLLAADGIDLTSLVSIDLYVGTQKFEGTWLANIPTPTSNWAQGNVAVDPTVANTTNASNSAAMNSLYIQFDAAKMSFRGDLSQAKKPWGGDINTPDLKGNFFFRVESSMGSPSLFFYLNSQSSSPLSTNIQWYSSNGTLLVNLAAPGDAFPLTGFRSISSWAATQLQTGTSFLAVGATNITVTSAQTSTFEFNLSTPNSVPSGPMGTAWLTFGADGALGFTVDFFNLSTATPDAALFLKKFAPNGTSWTQRLLNFSAGAGSNATRLSGSLTSLPDSVRAQFLLGIATGSLSLTLGSPKFPLGELVGSVNYDKFRISAASVCRGTWVIINENSVPIKFSLTKSQGKAVTNGFFLNAFAIDYFTVPRGANVFLKVAKQTRGNKNFFGGRAQKKCFSIKTICTGVWSVLSNVNIPLTYTYVVNYMNDTFISYGRKMFVAGGATSQTISSLDVASSNQYIQLFSNGVHVAATDSGKKLCPTTAPPATTPATSTTVA